MNKRAVGIGIAVVVVLVAIGAVVSITGKGGTPRQIVTTTVQGGVVPSSTSAYTTVQISAANATPIMITDPPELPAGTQSLVIAYSSVSLHETGQQAGSGRGTGTGGGTGGGGWVASAGGGELDLMTVLNSSSVIGYASVRAGSSINMVRFSIASAEITVNGTAYNVSVPNGNLTVPITSGKRINSSTGVLVEITPVVSPVYSSGGTSFVMAAAAKAIISSNVSSDAHAGLGSAVVLNAGDRSELEGAAPNITITAASLAVLDNVTNLSINVADNSNTNTTIGSIFISGPMAAVVQPTTAGGAVAKANITGTGNSGITAEVNDRISKDIETFDSIDFVASPSGSLVPLFTSEEVKNSGYVISAGANATFGFDGVFAYGSGAFIVVPRQGSVYRIAVIGKDGSRAYVNVTAS